MCSIPYLPPPQRCRVQLLVLLLAHLVAIRYRPEGPHPPTDWHFSNSNTALNSSSRWIFNLGSQIYSPSERWITLLLTWKTAPSLLHWRGVSLFSWLWREEIMCPPSLPHNSITTDGFPCHICLFYQASSGSALLFCNHLSFWKVPGLGFSTCSGIQTIHTLHYQGCQAQRSQGTTHRLILDCLIHDISCRHFCLASKNSEVRGKNALETILSN